MSDMTALIAPKSDQINADDLIGGDMTITITEVRIRPDQEQKCEIKFAGSAKVWRPCKTTMRIMVAAWGPDSSTYVGRSLQLYRDPDVKWGGLAVGGIRIRALTDIKAPMTMALTEKKGARKVATINVLKVEKPASAPAPAQRAVDPMDAAREAARNGKEAFTAFYNSDFGKTHREVIRANLAELKAIADGADNLGPRLEADPFAAPEADIMAELAARDRGLEAAE